MRHDGDCSFEGGRMPNPFFCIAIIVSTYFFCLIVSFLVAVLYGKRRMPESEPEPDDDRFFCIERTVRRRRRKKNASRMITIKGKLVNTNESVSASEK